MKNNHIKMPFGR